MKLGANEHSVICPHCGKSTQVAIDSSAGNQRFYEDCRLCCNAINLRVEIDELQHKVLLFVDGDDEQLY